MHPDDPPLSPIRGLGRIMRSVENYQRLIDLIPSPVNGICLCQGNFTLMTDDLPGVIRHFGEQDKIFFVHFRDVAARRRSSRNFPRRRRRYAACMKAYAISAEGVCARSRADDGRRQQRPARYSTIAAFRPRLHPRPDPISTQKHEPR